MKTSRTLVASVIVIFAIAMTILLRGVNAGDKEKPGVDYYVLSDMNIRSYIETPDGKINWSGIAHDYHDPIAIPKDGVIPEKFYFQMNENDAKKYPEGTKVFFWAEHMMRLQKYVPKPGARIVGNFDRKTQTLEDKGSAEKVVLFSPAFSGDGFASIPDQDRFDGLKQSLVHRNDLVVVPVTTEDFAEIKKEFF